jgi:diaminopimelate decarboxylase
MDLKKYQSQLNNIQTPCYVYDLNLLEQTLLACKNAADKYNFEVHYALKANVNPAILAAIQAKNFGADCVSGNEVKAAINAGFSKDKVVFAGVGKTDQEINEALALDIFCFNVESLQEIEIINELAHAQNKIAKIALRLNPNVNANTHHYITTGLSENKFGINFWELEKVIDLIKISPNIDLIGLHFHVGSQINDLQVFKNLCAKVNEFSAWFDARQIPLKALNLGGGLGIDYYHPTTNNLVNFEAYFAIFNQFIVRKPGQEIHFELGRSLVGAVGALLSRVVYIKEGIQTNFAILDAGMTDLLRPALYQAYHKIENLSKQHESISKKYDVVGPICESSDCFGKSVELPITSRGDLMVIYSTGAYGEVMSSNYNLREKAKVLLLQ